MIEISLSPSGDFRLRLSSGRTLDFANSIHGLTALHRTLFDAAKIAKIETPRPGSYPTQHLINKWVLESRRAAEAAVATRASETFGIDLSSLDLSL